MHILNAVQDVPFGRTYSYSMSTHFYPAILKGNHDCHIKVLQ